MSISKSISKICQYISSGHDFLENLQTVSDQKLANKHRILLLFLLAMPV